MSKGPKKKPARPKTGAKKKVRSTAKTAPKVKAAPKARIAPKSPPARDLPSQADAAGGDSSAVLEKKTGGGNASIAVLVFLGVLGAGVAINWMFWTKSIAPEKAGTQAEGAMPEPASKEVAPPDVQKDAQKELPKAAPKESTKEPSEDSAEQLLAERRQLRQALDRLMVRMEGIEMSLQRVKKMAQATIPPAEKLRSESVLEGLAGRLNSVEESGDKIEALIQRMDKMEKDYAQKATTGFAASASDAGAGSVAGNPGAGALVLAVGNLRQALATAEPFDKALDILKALAGASPEISVAVTLLAKNAPKGLPTRAILADRFYRLAGKIVQASREIEEKNWLDRAANRLFRLVSWRRVDGKDGAKDGGASIDALVAGAETDLKAGNLKAAIKAVEKLSVNENAAAVAASWFADAKARLAADRAIASLHLHAVTLLAPAPLTPPGSEKGVRR